jgi:hypothetical protein
VKRSSSSEARSRELDSCRRSLSPAQSASRRAVFSSGGASATSWKIVSRRRQRIPKFASSAVNRPTPRAVYLLPKSLRRFAGRMNQAFFARNVPVAMNAAVEPTPHELRVAVYRGLGDLHERGRLLRRAAEEVPELDELNLWRIERLQFIQGAVEFHHATRCRSGSREFGRSEGRAERRRLAFAQSLLRA